MIILGDRKSSSLRYLDCKDRWSVKGKVSDQTMRIQSRQSPIFHWGGLLRIFAQAGLAQSYQLRLDMSGICSFGLCRTAPFGAFSSIPFSGWSYYVLLEEWSWFGDDQFDLCVHCKSCGFFSLFPRTCQAFLLDWSSNSMLLVPRVQHPRVRRACVLALVPLWLEIFLSPYSFVHQGVQFF